MTPALWTLAGRISVSFVLALALASGPALDLPARADGPADRTLREVEAAIHAMMFANLPGQDSLATISNDNEYVQCRRVPGVGLRCEAAGALMQPSLDHVLTPERQDRLTALGWEVDPTFGNYAQSFPAGTTSMELPPWY